MNPGAGAKAQIPFVPLPGDSRDGHPHGGRDYEQPEFVSRRVQVRATDHPATDRWIALTTTRTATGSHLYVVGLVDGFNRATDPPREFPNLARARNYANKLYNAAIEEGR